MNPIHHPHHAGLPSHHSHTMTAFPLSLAHHSLSPLHQHSAPPHQAHPHHPHHPPHHHTVVVQAPHPSSLPSHSPHHHHHHPAQMGPVISNPHPHSHPHPHPHPHPHSHPHSHPHPLSHPLATHPHHSLQLMHSSHPAPSGFPSATISSALPPLSNSLGPQEFRDGSDNTPEHSHDEDDSSKENSPSSSSHHGHGHPHGQHHPHHGVEVIHSSQAHPPPRKEGGSGRISLSTLKAQQQEVVIWLRENYEVDEEISLARDAIYNHYSEYCIEKQAERMGTASFGKVIRLVFPEVKTRRLGVRGQSKYHYQGIRIKTSSLLPLSEAQLRTLHPHKRPKLEKTSSEEGKGSPSKPLQVDLPPIPISDSFDTNVAFNPPHFTGNPEAAQFGISYHAHCHSILNLIRRGDFNKINTDLMEILSSFWGPIAEADHFLLENQEVIDQVHHSDVLLYSAIIKTILPDVLRDIPLAVTQSIRNFGKSVQSSFQTALQKHLPQRILNVKMEVVKAFAQIIKRCTSLNHLSQAARAVWNNEQQVAQMKEDWTMIDFKNVHEQATFTCGCEENLLVAVEKQFELCLDKKSAIDAWPSFLERLVQHSVPHTQDPAEYRTNTKQFLLKWSYYCSALIRDLTLRSATSFGSFHLIRLYYEEYLQLLVDQQYTGARRRELENKFPPNFFEQIHPSMTIILDHTPYFRHPQSPSMRPLPSAQDLGGGGEAGSSQMVDLFQQQLARTPSSQSIQPPPPLQPQQQLSQSPQQQPPLIGAASAQPSFTFGNQPPYFSAPSIQQMVNPNSNGFMKELDVHGMLAAYREDKKVKAEN